MQHLATDRLAALADEPPTPPERAHLASCLPCRREHDAFVALLALAQREGAASRPADTVTSPADPLTAWDSLATSLRAEGLARVSAPTLADAVESGHRTLVRAADTGVRPVRHHPQVMRGVWRAAASLALLVGGAAVGRLTAPGVQTAESRQRADVAAASPTTSASATGASATAEVRAASDRGAATDASVRLAANGLSDTLPVYGEPAAGSMRAFASVADAMQALQQAQRDYQRAATYLDDHDDATSPAAPQLLRARLAALDEVMPKVREALYDAPQDPVLTQYYLTTADVRESTLRQLGRALPVGMRLNGY